MKSDKDLWRMMSGSNWDFSQKTMVFHVKPTVDLLVVSFLANPPHLMLLKHCIALLLIVLQLPSTSATLPKKYGTIKEYWFTTVMLPFWPMSPSMVGHGPN